MLVGVVEVAEGLTAEGGRATAVLVGEEVMAGGDGLHGGSGAGKAQLGGGMGVGRTCVGPRSPIPWVKGEGPTGCRALDVFWGLT